MKQYALLAVFVTVMLLPFVNKPFFIDDYYHYLMAEGITRHPLRPYDFLSDDENHCDAGWSPPMPARMVNPPLMHYYMALLIKIFGPSEFWMHIGFMVFPVSSALLLFFISSQFLKNPVYAPLILACSPVFWVTSTSFMLDSVKLTFYLGAIAALIAGLKKNSGLILALSGLCMGLAMLAKYTAASVFIVAAVYLYMFAPDWKNKVWIFAIPAAIMAAWSIWNIVTYGSPHLISAMSRTGASSWNIKLLTTAVFLSGGGIFPAFAAGLLPRRIFYPAALAAVFAACFVVFASPVGGFSAVQSALLALWISSTCAFFIAAASCSSKFSKSDFFILIWLAVSFLVTVPAMGWTAGRYYMTVLAPAAVLFAAMAEKLISSPASLKKFLAASLAVTFIVSGLLAATDYAQASVYIKIRDDLAAGDIPPSYFKSVAFIGLTGYLKERGWRTVVPGDDVLMPGDYFLEGKIASPVAWLDSPEIRGKLRHVKTYEYRWPLPFRILSIPGSAGFYATLWGALPWTLSTLPLERYHLYVVEKN